MFSRKTKHTEQDQKTKPKM